MGRAGARTRAQREERSLEKPKGGLHFYAHTVELKVCALTLCVRVSTTAGTHSCVLVCVYTAVKACVHVCVHVSVCV